MLQLQPEQDLFFRTDRGGVVYLLHFHAPIDSRQRNQHYIGYTTNLDKRLYQHKRKRKKSNLTSFTRLAAQKDIDFIVAQTWAANRSFEKYLKQQKNAKRYCPICQGDPLPDVHIPLYYH